MLKKIVMGSLIGATALFALPNNPMELAMIAKAAEKKAIVLSNMGIQGEMREKFGKVYDEYQRKLMEHRISEMKIIGEYAKDYLNMNDENADKLLDEWTKGQESEVALKKEYIEKFKKVMPAAAVIRYFQIENRLGLLRKLEISGKIPMAIPDMKISKKAVPKKVEKLTPKTEEKK
jgi:hypothetical protein